MKRLVKQLWICWKKVLVESDAVIIWNELAHKLVGKNVGKPQKCLFSRKWKIRNLLQLLGLRMSLVDDQGLEPWTPWLRVRCSASWANHPYSFVFSAPFPEPLDDITIGSTLSQESFSKNPLQSVHTFLKTLNCQLKYCSISLNNCEKTHFLMCKNS